MTSIIKVDNLQNQCGANIISESANVITIGASGDTVTLAAGASQSGFGRTGTVNWDTTAKTANFTAVNGVGYFANTSGGAFTMSLPAGSAGAIVSVADYTNSFQTNALTIAPNGSEKINGGAGPIVLNIEGQSLTLVYVDGTEGWKSVQDSTTSTVGSNFIIATGGTILTCGDYKTHVFTGPGTFTVTNAGQPSGSTSVDYLVVAGAGGGGGGAGNPTRGHGSGSGAGGFRMSNFYGLPAPTTSPLASPTAVPVITTAYPITVGGGGSGGPGGCLNQGGQGSNSIFSTITSTGGGGGKSSGGFPSPTIPANGNPGGSGSGGANSVGAAGSGNTPPVSPSQGNPGGVGSPDGRSSGGGGAGAAGTTAGAGGDGSYVSNTFFGPTSPSYGTPGPVGSTRYFAGGAGGSAFPGQSYAAGAGGAGGGAGGSTCASNIGAGNAGTVNTGGGSSPNQGGNSATGQAGGSGIVVIRYKFQ
jgi:hypothetical protein